jgi:uroporphyrinogen-III synthase
MDDHPLAGRRVVVTRPADQAAPLVELLESRGARVVVVPLTEIVDVPAALIELAACDPTTFDWVVVTSANAAHRLMAAHGERLADPDRNPARPALAGVGRQTAAILGRGSLVPVEQRAEGLLQELPAPTGTATVLVVQAVDAAATLVDGLVDRGWQVTAIQPYRSVARQPTAREQLAALSADVVLFAAGSAARAWVEIFGTTTPPIVVAMGPQTAAAAVGAGLTVTDVAGDHSLAGLVAAAEKGLHPPQ